MNGVVEVTKENFKDEVLEKDYLVVIDFWATWCGPCQMLSPIVDQLSQEITDVKFCKINVDEQPDLTMQFGIKSIPTLVFIKNSEKVDLSIGLISKEELEESIGRLK